MRRSAARARTLCLLKARARTPISLLPPHVRGADAPVTTRLPLLPGRASPPRVHAASCAPAVQTPVAPAVPPAVTPPPPFSLATLPRVAGVEWTLCAEGGASLHVRVHAPPPVCGGGGNWDCGGGGGGGGAPLTPFPPPPFLTGGMVKERITASGVSASLAQKHGTGGAYAECLLKELGLPDLSEWLKQTAPDGDDALRAGVSSLFQQMEKKVKEGDPWRDGAWKATDKERPIAKSHFNELMYALRLHINDARAACRRVTVLPNSWFAEIAAYKSLKAVMTVKFVAAAKEKGSELDQRRDRAMQDGEKLGLYRSMLSLSVRSSQLEAGKTQDASRKVLDTLTLCLIVSFFTSLGQRGLNLDSLVWGGLKIVQWTTDYAWQGHKPIVLQVSSAFKGGGAGEIKLFQMMGHRDVMQCPIAMLGLYFLYQFVVLLDPLPTLETWVDSLHSVALFRRQSQSVKQGGVSAISYFNVFLKEELEFIGADTNFTFHAFRNARIAEAGTDHAANRHDIMHGAGHSTGGSHSVSYNSLDASWIMGGAGYRGTDPEVLCPQQNLLHCYVAGGEYSEDADELMAIAFSSRTEWAQFCDSASSDNSEAGARGLQWVCVVKHSVLCFIVSCAFRPRDRFGYIDTDMCTKQELLGDAIKKHVNIAAVFSSDAYARLKQRALDFEVAELRMGELANAGAVERRTREQLSGMEDRMTSLPASLAAAVAPMVDEQDERRRDGQYRSERGLSLEVGDPELRLRRLEAEETTRIARRGTRSMSSFWGGNPAERAQFCDMCRSAGIPASQNCPHEAKRQKLCDFVPALAGCTDLAAVERLIPRCGPQRVSWLSSVLPNLMPGAAAVPPPIHADEQRSSLRIAALEEENVDLKRRLAASEELVSNLQSASANPAEEAADSAMVPPLKSLRNTSHLLRVYLDVVGPLELNRSWRLPPQVTQNEANCLRRQIADYTNYMLVVLDECKEEDFRDFWQAAERIEKRRKRGFTAIAKEAIKFAPERHSPLNNALQDEALFKRLRSLLKEAPSPPPVLAPAATVEAVASSSSDPLTKFYVAFDPSSSTGVARFTVRDGALVGVKLGLLLLPSSGSSGVRCLHLFDELSPWVSGATRGFIEPYFAHVSVATGTALNYEVRSVIQMALARASVEYDEIRDKKWKKAVAKKGDASKQEARAAVERLLSISLPPSVNNDTSDALCIGVCGLMGLGVRIQGVVALELT